MKLLIQQIRKSLRLFNSIEYFVASAAWLHGQVRHLRIGLLAPGLTNACASP